MKYKKYLIIFLLIILASLSGCIELITTQEKQACLALTHFSSTSIEGCFTQNSCFNQVDSLNIYSSKHIPYDIHNDLAVYKNYVASSYFHYNQTSKKIDKLNSACNEEKTKEIIDSVNDLLFYFSQTTVYLDQTLKQSINIIKDYALYLEKQEINLIVEEELFDDYVLINQNLNQLKDNKVNDTYLSAVDEKIKELHEFAKSLGIRQTYLSKQNASDLSLYYMKVLEEEVNANEIYVPELFGISSFILGKISKITDFRKINLNLSKVSAYNFYNLMNSFIGRENSLLTDFREMSNRVNYNIDKVFEKIEYLERKIKENENFLSEEDTVYLKIQETKFKNKEISFGKYLSTLKEMDLKINQNIVDGTRKDLDEKDKWFECDLIVGQAEKYTNPYYKEKIKKYKESDNLFEKKNICHELNYMMLEENCFEKITLFLESDAVEKIDFELMTYKDNLICKEILGNINFKLENNDKILFLKELIYENKNKLTEIELKTSDQSTKKEIIDYKNAIKLYDSQENIVKIIEIDKKINKLIEIDLKLTEIAKKIIESKKPTIQFIEENYYLQITNPFKFILENVEINNNYPLLKSADARLNVTNSKLQINRLQPQENYFKVEYENKKKITYKIIYLSLTESILKVNIENEVENIKDNFLFLSGFRTTDKDIRIIGDTVYYVSKKENEIYLIGNIFEVEIIKNIEEITSEKYIITENYFIKNRLDKKINQTINFKEINTDDVILLTENKKEIEINLESKMIKFIIDISGQETKEYQMQTLSEKNQVYKEIEALILKINKFNLTQFEDFKKEAQTNFKEILEINYKEKYTLNEIKLIYKKINQIEQMDLKLRHLENIEKKYFLKYKEIISLDLLDVEKNKLNAIDDKKYNNIELAEKEINELLNKITERVKKSGDVEFKSNQETISNLKERSLTYKLDVNVDDLIKNKTADEIEKIILNKLKEKATELYKQINPILNELNSREITDVVNKVYRLYQDYNLRDLYSAGYFAAITENDAKRLEKSSAFLDGALLNKEVSNFEEYFKNQEYEKAIDSISIETINRIEKIKTEVGLLEKGITLIKDDAKKEILNYQKEKYNADILEMAKNNYEDEMYLNTIMLIKTSQHNIKSNPKINQLIISLIIIIIFLAIYLYLKLGTKKKEKTALEKKRKIIRH